MCVDESPRHNPHRRRHDVGPVEVVGLEPAGMPVLIHPHFWRRRRVVLPGRDPFELPTTSANAIVRSIQVERTQAASIRDKSIPATGLTPPHLETYEVTMNA